MMSCSEDKCDNYFLITESSEKEAGFKCRGLANNDPKFEVISRVSIGCLNEKELESAKKTTTSITKNLCSGVMFTVRTRIEK